jgi:hypothetical protein
MRSSLISVFCRSNSWSRCSIWYFRSSISSRSKSLAFFVVNFRRSFSFSRLLTFVVRIPTLICNSCIYFLKYSSTTYQSFYNRACSSSKDLSALSLSCSCYCALRIMNEAWLRSSEFYLMILLSILFSSANLSAFISACSRLFLSCYSLRPLFSISEAWLRESASSSLIVCL